MRSRRLLFSSVCVFAVLVSVQLLAQSFAPAVPYGSGGNGPNAVAVADVNGDGIPDLVVANWCTDSTCVASSVGVLLGKGDGTFQPAVPYGSGGLYADSVAVADLRGTGKLDIVVGNCGFPKISTCDLASQGNIGVLLNNGDGTFPATATSYSLGPNIGAASVAIADLGNGTLDLIVAAGSATSSTVDVLVGNGDGTFKAAVPYDSGGFTALSVAVADVNGDNKPDVVVANWCTDNTCVA
ncbi:MAG: VCBS repeat-containing protein, partial [Terriglobales bacterium]